MRQAAPLSPEQARAIGERIGIDWARSLFDVEESGSGLAVELEHGRRDPATNVTAMTEQTTGKIAWAHINEFPDYYTRLAKMEAEAERYWSQQPRVVPQVANGHPAFGTISGRDEARAFVAW